MLSGLQRDERVRRLRRTAKHEFRRQWPLFKERWKTIVLGAAFQYVHAIFTQLAHRMARPTAEPLHDLGFALLPELGQRNEWVSELIFTTMLTSFVLWTFSPFWQESGKRFYTAVLYARVLMVLVICQSLRIMSFSVTTLPSPNYHCRLPQPTAVAAWPRRWWGHVVVNLSKQATHGCGDLIFSSHTTFALVGVMSYQEYGTQPAVKALVWTGAAILSVLIVASRKHYTVDVLIAWYVVPLVFYASHRRWTTKRSGKEEWPHRPLPEEQGPDVEGGLAEAATEVVQAPSTSQGAPMLGGGQTTSQRALQVKEKPSGDGFDGFSAAGEGRSGGADRAVMRPRSSTALAAAEAGASPGWLEEDVSLHVSRPAPPQPPSQGCRIQ